MEDLKFFSFMLVVMLPVAIVMALVCTALDTYVGVWATPTFLLLMITLITGVARSKRV